MHALQKLLVVCSFVIGLAAIGTEGAYAGLTPYDAPSLSCVDAGQGEITIKACAGASGAPAGITIHWMEKSVYDQYGWLSSDDPNLCALSLSGQPSLQHPGASRWELGPNQCEEILIGDINFDETGVSGHGCGLDPLKCGTEYVFRAFAHAGRGFGRSDWSSEVVCATDPCPPTSCTFTQGYWKNHGPAGCVSGNNSNEWPVTSLVLGSVNYTDLELCSILQEPGNGIQALAHQLIAAKLNIASGGGCTAVGPYILAADQLIGSKVVPPVGTDDLTPEQVSALTMTLDQFNNGNLAGCPLHCGNEAIKISKATQGASTEVRAATWGTVKGIYR